MPLHHQWKGPAGVKESVHGDQLQRVYWKLLKQKFCNVSSVLEKVSVVILHTTLSLSMGISDLRFLRDIFAYLRFLKKDLRFSK